MASKFQNRLVGTIVLVAFSVIVLPGLLDGKKKHYGDQFAGIPLKPKPGDNQDVDVPPPINEPLLVPLQNVEVPAQKPLVVPVNSDLKISSSAQLMKPESRVKTNRVATTKHSTEQAAPTGQAWVVQLGALKNAAKINEIVVTLRRAGYRAFTVPTVPIQGQITRLYVGPDASKQKLEAALSTLNSLSGLTGQIKAYSTDR